MEYSVGEATIIEGAVALDPSLPVLGNLQPGGEVDFFAFEAEANHVARINLDYNIIRGGIALRLHDSEGRIFYHNEHPSHIWHGQPFEFSENKRITRLLPASGTYYVSVFSLSSNQLGYYRLSLELENVRDYPWRAPVSWPVYNVMPFPSRFDVDADSLQSATPVDVGKRTFFSVEEPSATKIFKFEALEGEIYTIFAGVDYSNFGVLVLDPNGELVAEAYGYNFHVDTTSFEASLSGTYFIAVKAKDWAGRPEQDLMLIVEFDDHGDEIYSATSLTLGEEIRAEGYDLDFFKFTAQKGRVYSINVDEVGDDTHLALYTPDELILASLAGDGQRLPFKWRAKTSGLHYLTILNAGDYTLTVDSVESDEGDDFGDDLGTATQLAVGQDVEGVIEINSDIDMFRFVAEDEEAYVISLISDVDKDLSGWDEYYFAATVELLNSDGVVLLRSPTGHNNWGYEARMLWEPPASGKYYLKVYSNWHGNTVVGDYLLNVEVSTYKDVHEGSIYDATPLVIGESQDGFIGCYHDVDTFKFQGKAKTAYRVMLEKEYPHDISITVHDDDGLYLGPRQYHKLDYDESIISPPWQPDLETPRCVDFEANPEPDVVQEFLFFNHNAGELFVHLDGGRIGHNRYTITVLEDEYRDDHGDQQATASDVRFGEVIEGVINLAGESDVFRFRAEEDQAFEFELLLDSLSGVCLLLVPEKDLPSEEWCTWSGSESEARESYITAWVAPSDGDFFLVVQSDDFGSYSLSLKPIDLTDDHSNDHNQATSVQFSVPTQGRIDKSEDVDVFSFDAEDGDVISLILSHEGLSRVDVDLYGRIDGEYLRGRANHVDSLPDDDETVRRSWRTNRAGTHYLVVQAVSVGQYSITLTRAEYEDDVGNNLGNAQVIATGVRNDGVIEITGDIDFFSFEAVAGKVYSVDLISRTIENDNFRLYDSEGTILDIYFNHEFEWQPTSTGTFYIAVYDTEYLQEAGNYRLFINHLPNDDHGYDFATATSLIFGSITPGELNWGHESDFFKFEAIEGEQYLISLDQELDHGIKLGIIYQFSHAQVQSRLRRLLKPRTDKALRAISSAEALMRSGIA